PLAVPLRRSPAHHGRPRRQRRGGRPARRPRPELVGRPAPRRTDVTTTGRGPGALPVEPTRAREAPTTPGAVLDVRDLRVSFPSEGGTVTAVRGMSYSVAPGEVLGIVGESGSGKSVSSLAVMGLLPSTTEIRGSIRFR